MRLLLHSATPSRLPPTPPPQKKRRKKFTKKKATMLDIVMTIAFLRFHGPIPMAHKMDAQVGSPFSSSPCEVIIPLV